MRVRGGGSDETAAEQPGGNEKHQGRASSTMKRPERSDGKQGPPSRGRAVLERALASAREALEGGHQPEGPTPATRLRTSALDKPGV